MGAVSRFGRDICKRSRQHQQGAVHAPQVEGQLLPGIGVIGWVPEVTVGEAGLELSFGRKGQIRAPFLQKGIVEGNILVVG
jgi:hypothetical protein